MKEKRTRIRRKNAGYKKMFLLFIIVFIFILVVTKVIFPATVSLSRFVYSAVKGAYLNSREFYFTSNRMSRMGTTYEVNDWSGTDKDTYEFQVNMYSRKNSLKTSNVDIIYQINLEVQAYKSNGEKLSTPISLSGDKDEGSNENIIAKVEKTESRIFQSSNQDDFYIRITPNNYTFNVEDYVEVKMEANAISPYTDTIKGIYRIYVGREGISSRIDDSENNPYLNVILTNAKVSSDINDAEDVEIEFNPQIVVLDTTSTEYINAEDTVVDSSSGYFKKIKIRINPLESKFIKFYKTSEYSKISNIEDAIKVNY